MTVFWPFNETGLGVEDFPLPGVPTGKLAAPELTVCRLHPERKRETDRQGQRMRETEADRDRE